MASVWLASSLWIGLALVASEDLRSKVLDMMFGAAYHRLLQGHRPLTDQFARRVVDLIVAGVTAS